MESVKHLKKATLNNHGVKLPNLSKSAAKQFLQQQRHPDAQQMRKNPYGPLPESVDIYTSFGPRHPKVIPSKTPGR